jgi:hypothetical protein
MVLYHRGAAIQPSASKRGEMFVATASILEEDGETTSLGILGRFANEKSAFEFAVRSAAAFVEGEPMPLAPFETAETA